MKLENEKTKKTGGVIWNPIKCNQCKNNKKKVKQNRKDARNIERCIVCKKNNTEINGKMAVLFSMKTNDKEKVTKKKTKK